HVDLAADGSDARVVDALGEGGQPAPVVRGRIVAEENLLGLQPGKAPRPPSTYILPSSATPTTSSSPWGIGFIWLQRPCASAGPAVRSTASRATTCNWRNDMVNPSC